MSMISELVKELRELQDDPGIDCYGNSELRKVCKHSADIIEELSAKLHNSQMERSSQYYNGGWIPCDERMPEEHKSMFAKLKGTDKWSNAIFESISDDVNVTVEFEDGSRKTMTLHTCDGEWKTDFRIVKFKVIAWQPLPKPYG